MLTFEGAQTQGAQAIVEKLVVCVFFFFFSTYVIELALPKGAAQGRHARCAADG